MNPLDTVDLIENNFYKTETVLCNIKKKNEDNNKE